MIYSEYQERIFDFCANGKGSAIVKAVAGSGKTTTIVEAFRRVNNDVLMLAFNNSIAKELKKRVSRNVSAATFHSVGFRAWSNYVGKVQVDGDKVRQIISDNFSPRDKALYGAFVRKLVSFAKGAGIGKIIPDVHGEWIKLCLWFDCYPDAEDANWDNGIELARAILIESNKESDHVIDFDDMLYMPLIRDCAFEKFPFVSIDEAQDTNGVQRALLHRMLDKTDGRLLCIGDPKQSIYGFRGADSTAMALIQKEFNCAELPLTVSYRCAQTIVRAAQQLVPYIESCDTAPKGEVTYLNHKWKADRFTQQDAIICRNTAPLVSMAFHLIGCRVPCKIMGRDIGKGLVDLVNKMKAKDVDELKDKLHKWATKEIEKLIKNEQGDKCETVTDKVTCIDVFIRELPLDHRTIAGLINSIESLFRDEADGILTLCTVHRAKGLEWRTVYILDAGKYMPSKYARQPWQKEQEMNIIYVAITRAKESLFYIDSQD